MPGRADDRDTISAQRLLGPVLVLLALALLLYGWPVPRLSEELYLPLVKRVGDAAYLRGDWTFSGGFGEHWLFDHILAPVGAALSISTFGWIGRLLCWPVLLYLLVRIGTRLRCSPWLAAVALGLWLMVNQSIVGGEWIVGTFEAKAIAYIFLLGAILAATRARPLLAVVLLGLTLSFHPAVGLWGAWGVGLALLWVPETRRGAIRWCWLGAIIAIPGILGAISASTSAGAAADRFLVLEAIPYHTDPFFGGNTLGTMQVSLRVATLVGMFAFNLWAYRRSDQDLPQRFLVAFQIAAAVPYFLAFPARAAHLWSYLELMPLRSFPLFVPLIFFFQAVRLLLARWTSESSADARGVGRHAFSIVAGAALLVIAIVPSSPLVAAPRMVLRNYEAWTKPGDEVRAFSWVRQNTRPDTTCIFPVERQDSFERAQRPQVANWQAIRYDELAEWRTRINALVGGADYFTRPGWRGDLDRIRTAYNSLTQRQIEAIARRYHATCLVSTTRYAFPLLHRSGTARVYRIDGKRGSLD